jgi:hypothetical protein
MFAAVRPDDFDFPLLIHVGGAVLLVGALITALIFAVSQSPSRLTFRALLWAAIPSFIVMRVSAEWVAHKEGLTGNDLPSWVNIGHIVSDPAALAIIIATVIAGVGAKNGGTTSKWVAGLVSLTVGLSLVAVWAMTTKPS